MLLKLGRGGAGLRAAVGGGLAGALFVVPAPKLSWLVVPFEAPFHEALRPWIFAAVALFFAAVALGKIGGRWAYGLGLLDALLAVFTLTFRISLSGGVEPVALVTLAAFIGLAAAMVCGYVASPRSATAGRWTKRGALAAACYLVFAAGLYPLTYGICAWRQPADRLEAITPAPAFDRYSQEVGGQLLNAYYGELHGHSYFSMDARLFGAFGPEDYYDYARDVAGLDFCALTDHDTPNGISDNPELWRYVCSLADRYHEPGRFVTFKAFEWTSGEGHHEMVRHWRGGDREAFRHDLSVWGHRNVFFPGDDVPTIPFSHADQRCDTPEELWALMDNFDAIAIPHHSLGGPVPAFKWDHYSEKHEPLVEIYSAHGNSESATAPLRIYNRYANADGSSEHSVQHALSLGYRFGLIAASDTHAGWGGNGTTRPEAACREQLMDWIFEQYGEKEAVGGGLMGVLATELTRESLWQAFLAKRTFGTTGPRMVAVLKINNTLMGGVVKVKPGQQLNLEAEIVGEKPLRYIEVVSGAKVVHRVEGNGRRSILLSWQVQAPASGQGYYYVRAQQLDDEMVWSSPVFVE